jgi:hypothetical protein
MNIKLFLLLIVSAMPWAGQSAGQYTAHEWGTFTSVQGGDGTLLEWRPLESSRLPGFVYDWRKPGLQRVSTSGLIIGKGSMLSLQRMETPVIYFYADLGTCIDVSVDFPRGTITEWYPQATQIGPATVAVPPLVAELDQVAHRVGASPGFTLASVLETQALKASRVHWANVQVLPRQEGIESSSLAPPDRSESHYFAARDTEANLVQINSFDSTKPTPEREKFLFYRGIGNFGTPLRVTMAADEALTIANTGKESIKHLFVLTLHDGSGGFVEVDQLAPNEQRTIELGTKEPPVSVQMLSQQVGQQIAKALVSEGLYAREASAMVKTWRNSWFEEDGVRVLYTLSRAWTDRTLPLKLKPAPRNLVRVMVGRAEVIAPSVETSLLSNLTKSKDGDKASQINAERQLQTLGRFAEPALSLATRTADPQLRQAAWEVFRSATQAGVLARAGN